MSKCKITGNVLAIQLGREEIQIALIGKNGEIQTSLTLNTPVGAVEDGTIQNAELIAGMLKSALKAPVFKHTRQVVFSLCTTQVITEIVSAPDLPQSKLERLLMANIDMYFPVAMQDYHVVWQTIGPKISETGLKELSVQLWAVPRAMLTPYYIIANSCGLSVAAIDYCGNSIANLVGASFVQSAKGGKPQKKFSLNMEIGGSRKKEEAAPADLPQAGEAEQYAVDTDLHILLERDMLGMTFVQSGRVVYQRFVQCGADPTLQFTELSMMLEYFRSLGQGRGSEIRGYLCGSLATNQELVEELADMLDVEMHAYGAPFAPELCLCVGAARTTFDFGNPELNRPGKARRQVTSQLWQYLLILVSGAVLTGVIMLVLTSRLNWSSQEKSLESTMQNWTIQAKQSAGYADNYNAYSSLYNSYSADWDTIFSSLQTYNDNLVRVLQELEDIMPEKSSVVKLQINADGINVEFACEDKEEAAFLIMALRELQYADLVGISNLTGGGIGAATSFGTQGANQLPIGSQPATGNAADENADGTGNAADENSEVEAPPTVGSGKEVAYAPGETFTVELLYPNAFGATLRANQPLTVTDLIKSELTEEELMGLASEMTPDQFVTLETAYGKMPTNINTSLEVLKLAQGTQNIDQQRKATIREMLTTNPFAMNHFMDLIEEDFERTDEKPILLLELMKDDEFKQLIGDMPDENDVDTLRKYLDDLVSILVKDETKLSCTERLICTSDIEEKWYVYYLEVELGQQQGEQFPYLDTGKVITDMLDGHFDTTDSVLNEKLNALISNDTWTLIKKLGSETELQAMMNQYLTTGTTGNQYMDGMIETYLTTGTTGVDAVDERIEAYIASGKMDSTLESLMNKYFETGSTDSDMLDQMISDYLTTGTTGSKVIDDYINEYIESDAFNTRVKTLLDAYAKNGTTGYDALDDMIEDLIMKYMKDKTTGNDKIDKLIKDYLDNLLGGGDESSKPGDESSKPGDESSKPNDENSGLIPGYSDAQIEELIMKYITTGSTGIEYLDELIDKYIKTGTTGNKKLDDIVEDYIEQKADEFTKEQVAEMMNKYLTTGSTGNKAYDELIQKFIKTGTTGNEKLDQMIKDFVTEYMKNSQNGSDSLMGAIDSLFGAGTGTGEQVDTRIHFVVTLGYNDELKNAELSRKGLNYDEKINKVEVTE